MERKIWFTFLAVRLILDGDAARCCNTETSLLPGKNAASIFPWLEHGKMRKSDKPIFYVYILFDWLGIPRYVGKGNGDRWLSHELKTDKTNWMKNEFIEQTWIMLGEIPKIKIIENVYEKDALNTEVELIKVIGRLTLNNGPLVNLTDGGEGASGLRWSKESKRKRSILQIKRMSSPELREQIRLKLLGRVPPESEIQKMIKARHHSGIKQKPWSNEGKENARLAALNRPPVNIETRIKMGNSRRGAKHTEETKLKMSVSAILVQGPRRRKECQENPKAIEHMIAMSHKRRSNPNDSVKRAEIAKNLWADPIYRERVILARKLARIKKIQELHSEIHSDIE